MKLKKEITCFGVFSLATGAMISSGIFILPGLAFAQAGSFVFISYFLAGVLALFGIFNIIELSTAMPKAGGDYYFINRSLGPMIGTISGFLGWFALSLKSAFAIFGIAEFLLLTTGLNLYISAAALCLIFIALNIAGVKEATFFQILMVITLLGLIAFYLVFAFPKVEWSLFNSFSPKDLNPIIFTAGFIFISFGGLLKVAGVSEEVKDPKRDIPLGLILSILVVTILYTLIVTTIVGTVDAAHLKDSLTPASDSAANTMGFPGYVIIVCASLLAFITTANAGIMSASRYPLALSRDNLIPASISRVNRKFQTPTISIIITGGLIYGSLFLPLEILIKLASTVILTSYVLTSISVIILRESRLINYKPSFKSPFYPWTQLIGIILFSFFIFDLGAAAIEISLAILFLCFCLYFFYGRKKNTSEYALLHWLKRITDKKLTQNLLDNELRDILITRDHIEQDQFDNLVKRATILDLKGPLELEEFLKAVSKELAQELHIPKEEIFKRFLDRQRESNTAISDYLAIPHIVMEGEKEIFMMLARCREGIKFTAQENNIRAVFLFGGNGADKNLHLRTLASLATLVQQEGFLDNWLHARTVNDLRSFILLSKRQRFF